MSFTSLSVERGEVTRQLLDVGRIVLLNLTQRSHIAIARKEVDRHSLAAKAAGAANAVDVAREVSW